MGGAGCRVSPRTLATTHITLEQRGPLGGIFTGLGHVFPRQNWVENRKARKLTAKTRVAPRSGVVIARLPHGDSTFVDSLCARFGILYRIK